METKLTEQQINEIEARANAATPGPWNTETEFCDCGGDYPCGHPDYPTEISSGSVKFERFQGLIRDFIVANFTEADNGENNQSINNATFIAASRSDIPALVSDWRALRAEVARLTSERDAAGDSAEYHRHAYLSMETRIETLQEMYRYDHDIRIAQEEKIKQLESEITYLRSTDHAADQAFEKWSRDHAEQELIESQSDFGDETPLGQALDGAGDEG